MKRLKFTAALLAILAFAGTGWAIPLGEVGLLDTYTGDSIFLGNSGDGAEEAWIQSILGSGYTLDYKYPSDEIENAYPEDKSFGDVEWLPVDDEYYWAWEFTDGYQPEYFFLKLGVGSLGESGSVPDHFLFLNEDELNWAVVDLSALGVESLEAWMVGRISHIGGTGGTTQVPEPGSLLLLGLGMVALAGVRRKLS